MAFVDGCVVDKRRYKPLNVSGCAAPRDCIVPPSFVLKFKTKRPKFIIRKQNVFDCLNA